MDSFIEEYGFIIISVLCAMIIIAGVLTGLEVDGFLGKAIIDFANSIIGG